MRERERTDKRKLYYEKDSERDRREKEERLSTPTFRNRNSEAIHEIVIQKRLDRLQEYSVECGSLIDCHTQDELAKEEESWDVRILYRFM